MTPRTPSTRRRTPGPATTQGDRPPARRGPRRGWTALALGPAVAALAVAVPAHPGSAAPALVPAPVTAAPVAVAPVEAADDPATHPHGGGTHMVTPGETLSGIAAANGTTVAALAAANGLSDPDLVVAATSLTLASGDGAVAPGPSAAPSAPSSSAGLPSRLQARPDRLAHRPLFARWAAANSVPLDLLEAMTWLESGWQNGLVSPDGAVGIGQLMPGTVEHMELLIGVDLDPYVVEDNIRMSARYLRWLLSRYGGDSGDALAAYYQGHASVARNGRFSDTQTYVENILALRNRF